MADKRDEMASWSKLQDRARSAAPSTGEVMVSDGVPAGIKRVGAVLVLGVALPAVIWAIYTFSGADIGAIGRGESARAAQPIAQAVSPESITGAPLVVDGDVIPYRRTVEFVVTNWDPARSESIDWLPSYSQWAVAVGQPQDVTDELTDREARSVAPDHVIVGFPVEVTLLAAKADPSLDGIRLPWGVVNVSNGTGWAAYPDPPAAECDAVAPGSSSSQTRFAYGADRLGSTVTGLVCVEILATDLEHPDTQVSLDLLIVWLRFGPDSG